LSATPDRERVPGKLRSLVQTVAVLAVLVLPSQAGAVVRTPSGWVVNPVGTQLLVNPSVGGFQGPLGTALSPDGRFALAASSGAARFQNHLYLCCKCSGSRVVVYFIQ